MRAQNFDSIRVHDWAGKIDYRTLDPLVVVLCTAPLPIPVIASAIDVLHCSLGFIDNGFLVSRGRYPYWLTKDALWKTFHADEDFEQFMGGVHWTEALSAIPAYTAAHAYFSLIASSSLSNRNREARVHYFGNLGYENFYNICNMNDEERAA